MPEYPYTDTEERVFCDLAHGPDVRVRRGGELLEVAEEDAGSTVVLRAGDVLVTTEPLPFAHAFLEGSTPPAPEPAAPVEVAEAAEADEPVEQPAPGTPPRRRRASVDTPTDTPPDAA